VQTARSFRIFLACAIAFTALEPLAASADHTGRPGRERAVSTHECAHVLRALNPRIAPGESLAYADALLADARRLRLDPLLVMALVNVESSWNPHAVSVDGAVGLGQLMPDTAQFLGVLDSRSVSQNLRGTTTYLNRMLATFRAGRQPVREALAGYTLGPLSVQRYGGVPPSSLGPRYVSRVLLAWQALRDRFAAETPRRPRPARAFEPAPAFDPTLAWWTVRS
jgi:soluble lytic murein transglycosylase-like protein